MNPRGHREIAAVLMLLALVLSAMALLPARAQAATNQVTGLVSQCGSSTTFVGGATVTLMDADGALSSLTTTTASDGTFSFTPQAANYTLKAAAPGYYPGNVSAQFRFDGSTTVTRDLCLDRQLPAGKTSFPVTFHVRDANTLIYIGGATVSVVNSFRQANNWPAFIASGVTNGTAGPNAGNVTMSLWSDSIFNVQVNATGYGVFIETMTISGSGTINIGMSVQSTVVGHARNTQGQFVTAGLVATLYNLGVPNSNQSKVINGVVSGSLYTIYAPAGSYKLIVDANGYTAFEQAVTLTTTPQTISADATLAPSAQEKYLTTVLFGRTDWNNLTIYRNWTLLPDSTVTGLFPAGLRDLRQQINFTFGNGAGNGVVSAGDIALFTAWLAHNGPLYVTTDGFFLLNGKSYNSSMTSFRVLLVAGLGTAGANVQIDTVATYQVKSSAWIAYGQPKDYLNMTLYPDTNTTVYHNETYVVQMPRAYEMATATIVPSGSITTTGYTNITVDPGLLATGQPQIRMVLQQSLTGTARASIVGPSGKFYVVNSTYQNYQAYVAQNTNLNFSAQQSTDPVGDITAANFTWEFQANVNQAIKGWGITTTYKYPVTGQFTVNLTVVQAGGNITYRDITLWVDGMPPTADFKTNMTGSGSAKGLTLRINQSTEVRFDASLSTDQAYTNKSGVIPNSGYNWVMDNTSIPDANGRIVNWTFATPGWYVIKLNVTDGVGWKGANATMIVIVNDTQAPTPAFSILDPTNDYAPVTTLIEGHNYTFNASKTTDNYDKLANLTFNWTIPGPVLGQQGTTVPFSGMNITFEWTSWNYSYKVVLTVADRGFGIGKPNVANQVFNESVQIYRPWHPDLYINVGSMKVSNQAPDSGSQVTITLNVTNKVGWGTASNVEVSVAEVAGTESTSLMNENLLGDGWSMTSKSGAAAATVPAGSTVTLTITVTVVGQGNKTLSVLVKDKNEAYTLVTAENTASQSIVVNQPAWVTYAIVAAIVGVFAVVVGAMYYRRKVKAGDWQPRFRRSKKEEGGKEKPRKEKEVKEEKKRL